MAKQKRLLAEGASEIIVDESTAIADREQQMRNIAVIRLLDEWLADESGYDEAVWPTAKQAIEEHRLSGRRRFRE